LKIISKEARPYKGWALIPKFSKGKTWIPNQVRDDKTQEQNPAVTMNLFQHLIKPFLPVADTSVIPVHTNRGIQEFE